MESKSHRVFVWSVFVIAVVFFLIGVFSSCKTAKPAVGCSDKEQKEALRLFNLALDHCPEAIAYKASLMWPPKVYDRTRIEYLTGPIDTQRITEYTNCDSIMKLAATAIAKGEKPPVNPVRVPYENIITRQRDTIKQLQETQAVNTAEIEASKADIKSLSESNTILQVAAGKKDQQVAGLQWYKWAFFLALAYIAGAAIARRSWPVIGKFIP